ncbi:bifunctional phosphopantothenoylcysteine decarboxylase/phosphopantothenate--cysteine ligase CoaBC [Candidatus Pelagibacter sp. HIMB1517]|uniref:bifunctional phosphopantothenoylcysteine decarboxylase/phosphopantothenate--cysteine ligase CoaBC n=1 Tax=Candidatus Pelagibacter sp. HIMB1517 TaxID=3413341 RepID=UPI003F85115E
MKNNKKILLIISGGIAAYKTLDLIRNLRSKNYEIKTILTKTAEEFVTPLSISSLSNNKVYLNKFDLNEEIEMDHIALSRWADLILVAPATANIIENISNGSANDFINTVILASNKKIFLAPAMNVKMWEKNATQINVEKLKKRNFSMIGPSEGLLACGEFGEGRMANVNEIEFTIDNFFIKKDINLSAVVTAGPTREYIDPVRYISNESSGLQGYYIAKKMVECGIKTKLIMGPSQIKIEDNINTVKVTTAQEMLEAVKESLPTDIAVCSAAVSDFRTDKFEQKIKKNNKDLNLKLYQNMDILSFISNHNNLRPKLVVGFAAETNNVIEYAKKKLEQKHCDWIIANDVSDKNIGFNSKNNEISIIHKNQEIEKISKREKSEIATLLVQKILKEFTINENKSLN